jgi:hypothetical protein
MPGSVTVTWNRSTIDNLLRSPSGPVGRDLDRRGSRVMARARSLAPMRTGALKASIRESHTTVHGEQAARVTATAPYALFVHQGRGQVRARVGGHYLRWPARLGEQARTGYVFTRQARATKPVPYLRQAIDAAR